MLKTRCIKRCEFEPHSVWSFLGSGADVGAVKNKHRTIRCGSTSRMTSSAMVVVGCRSGTTARKLSTRRYCRGV